ncbi:glucosyltransferase domain-containing protein [Proteus mirabilis]|uniref:glucosyltransferase domain-containing protein n=1 Tax=Proteus mirabilis TaxID=584 RepID=UPI0021BAA6A8|nr:glucosyltransferase domain-containing protein [Proteus mirabilis]MCT8198001.1 glucosyltransferase domain-containing protein [Proteus mirabilis]
MENIIKNYKYHYIIFLIIVSPYIINDIYVYDDIFRMQKGYYGWIDDGRFLSEFFYKIMSLGANNIPDLYPIPLILSGVFFCFSFKRLTNLFNIENNLTSSLLMASLLSCPMLVSNFSFRYDGAFMILSMSFAILSLTVSTKNIYLNVIISSILLSFAFSTYQASVNIFIALSSILFLFNAINKNNKLMSDLLVNMITVFISYIIYSKFYLEIFEQSSYASNFNKIIQFNDDGINILLENLTLSFNVIKLIFTPAISIILLIIFSIFIINLILNKKINLLLLGCLIITISVTILSSSGVILFGVNAKFYPRVFMGLSVFFMLFPLIISFVSKNNSLINLCTLAISLPLILVNQTAINSIKNEINFSNQVSEYIYNDINALGLTSKENYHISGTLKVTPNTRNNINVFPIISHLIPKHFVNFYDGGRFTLMKNGFSNITYNKTKQNIINKHKPLRDNNIYSLYYINDTVYLIFKD